MSPRNRTSSQPHRGSPGSRTRLAVAAAATCAAVALSTPGALAHVTVNPVEAPKGGYTVLTFRMPNESDTAGTVKLEVTLPENHTLTSVRTQPMPGWTPSQTRRTLGTPIESHGSKITEVVDTITWTAEPGVRIGPNEFSEFPISVGRLPDNTDSMVIKAVQTYDDGRVVAWDTPPPASGEEPEHPAPVLRLVDGGDGGHGHGGSATSGASPAAGTDNTARLLGGIGLGVGALGLGIGIGSLMRGRNKA